MLKVSNLNRLSKTFVFAGILASFCVSASCGGSIIGGELSAEFVYVATGTTVAQYAVSANGQLVALNPASVTTNATAITIDKAGKYLYAVNQSNNTIAQYTIGGTGLLTAMATPTVTTGASPTAAVVSPNGQFVFVLNSGSNTITGYTVGATGALTADPAITIPTAADGTSLITSSSGSYLYATSYSSGKISAYAIATDGTLTALSTPTYNVGSSQKPVFSANGSYLYVPDSTNGVAQFSVAGDGSLTPLTPAVVAGPAVGNDAFAITPDGKYGYLGSFNGGNPGSPVGQYSIGVNGTLTPLTPASVTAGNAPMDIAIEAMGKFLYVANPNDGTVSEFSIGADGTLSALSPATVSIAGARQIIIIAR